MKFIKLTQNKKAMIDDVDFQYLNQWKWHYHHGYAARTIRNKKIYMHRIILDTPEGLDTDHINRNTLDNRRCNLRAVTHRKNIMNTGIRTDNTSDVKGVSWHKASKKWRAFVYSYGKQTHLGLYRSIKEAELARNTWKAR